MFSKGNIVKVVNKNALSFGKIGKVDHAWRREASVIFNNRKSDFARPYFNSELSLVKPLTVAKAEVGQTVQIINWDRREFGALGEIVQIETPLYSEVTLCILKFSKDSSGLFAIDELSLVRTAEPSKIETPKDAIADMWATIHEHCDVYGKAEHKKRMDNRPSIAAERRRLNNESIRGKIDEIMGKDV